MATPYVAGVAALYIGVHGGRSVHGKALLAPWIFQCSPHFPLD
jgi:hypothetical protein